VSRVGHFLRFAARGNDSVRIAVASNDGNVSILASTNPPMPDTFLSANIEVALHAGIAALREDRTGKERNYYRISGVGMCPRKQVAERAGLPPTNPPDPRSVFKMWAGTVLHEAAQKALTSVGYLNPLHTEAEVTYECYVGHPDGVTQDGNSVVELKTTDDNAIVRYEMPLHYLWQGFTYCLALKKTSLVVLQVGRSQGLTRSRVYHLNDEFIMALDDHVRDMTQAWATYKTYNTLPPHDHTRFSWQEKTCPYLDVAGRPNPEV